jgi:hypothetical protein
MTRRILIGIVLAVMLASCALVGGKPSLTFNATVPDGWRKIPYDDDCMLMTRDGGYKQFVLIRERPLDEPFQFTKRTLSAGMMPTEAAEIVVNEIISDSNIRNFSLTENTPARIAGNDGFRLSFLYTDVEGYFLKTIYYGFIKGNTFYNIRYGATQEEYFQKDIKTFEEICQSFKLVAAK